MAFYNSKTCSKTGNPVILFKKVCKNVALIIWSKNLYLKEFKVWLEIETCF